MTQPEYEQKKRECWDALYNELLKGEVQWQPVNRKEIVNFAFDRAYALGKLQASCRQVKETITKDDVEKAAEEFADKIKIPASLPGALVPMLHDIAKSSYLQGAQDFIGKQERDAEDTVICGWVARDEDGNLFMYSSKPERIGTIWYGESANFEMRNRLFPDLTWDDEPQECEIIIKRKKNG